jgi:Yip1-like protein
MNCPKCKNPNPIEARFCGVCGQQVGEAAPAARSAYSAAPAIPAGASAGGAAGAASAGELGSGWSAAGILTRIKNILLSPKAEWPAIAAEPTSLVQLYVGYVAPLTAWAALMSLVHLTLIGTRLPFGSLVHAPLAGGLSLAAWTFVASFVGLFLVGLIVNVLAPTFGGTRDKTQALKVAAYSLTPAYCGSVLALSPVLPGLMQFIVLCYGLYVLYLGLPVLMRAPQSRALGYTATVVVCCFVLGLVIMLVTMGLGIYTNSAGIMGNNPAKADSADQSAAILGNGVGEILGTDAKGKAGITAAVSNLIKAGDQAAVTANPPSNNGLQNAALANSSPDSAQNAGAAVGALLGALGGALGGDHPKAAVDFKSLTPLLPLDLPGMKRTAASGESQGAIGIRTSSATGIYQGGTGNIKVEITDMSAVSGLMGMAGALVQNTTSESDTGFERDQVIGGRSAHEKYDAPSKHGDITIMVAKRYQVDVSGDGVDMNTLEQALGRIDLARLEGMKDQGSAPQ